MDDLYGSNTIGCQILIAKTRPGIPDDNQPKMKISRTKFENLIQVNIMTSIKIWTNNFLRLEYGYVDIIENKVIEVWYDSVKINIQTR